MLDIKFIRENKDIVLAGAKKKHMDFDVDALIALDDKRLELLKAVESLRAEQNQMSGHISVEKDPTTRSQMIEEMRIVKEEHGKKDEEWKAAMKQWQEMMLYVPNVPDISAPEGVSEEENVEIRLWGEKPSFDFEPKDHVEIMTALGMLDVERGTKVHGFRGYF